MTQTAIRDKLMEFFDPEVTRPAEMCRRLVYSGVADMATRVAFQDARERGVLGRFPDLTSGLEEVRTWNAAVDGEPVTGVHLQRCLRQISEVVTQKLAETISRHTRPDGNLDMTKLPAALRKKAASVALWLEAPRINHIDARLPRSTDLYDPAETNGGDIPVYAMRIIDWQPELLVRDFDAKSNWRPADRAEEPGIEVSL